ncbi:MAG: ABC transporter permease [Nitrospira sp.]|jgi:lipopolysaccharide transport system permease protein|nr:ABC transporter permease [Nitrospira sp.]MDR4475139.1 ABC transporter permease [Nitrospira sp.]HAP38740.1 phosphate ABC transporter permease [Nitrospira sp.]
MSVVRIDQGHSATLPHVRIQPAKGLLDLDFAGLWNYRELIHILVWRDVTVRYKQTVLGVAWAMFQPVATMLIFTAVFSVVGKIPSDGFPYPVFLYAGLLPWFYISQALSRGGTSLVGEAPLISKVYFPRLILPLSATIAPLVDLVLAFVAFLGLMAWFGVVPTWRVLLLPLFAGLGATIALAAGLWVSALYVRYRDVGHILPMFIQLWMFVSPILYPVSKVPESWRAVYALNPVVSVVEGFRWALIPGFQVDFSMFLPSLIIVAVTLVGGLIYFRSMERTFADVI